MRGALGCPVAQDRVYHKSLGGFARMTMPGKPYRPLEAVLGYYDLGNYYTVFASGSYQHQTYTAVHENTHAIIGWSSSFGLFQSFLAYLAQYGPPTLSSIATDLLSISIDDVRELHEATATYAEFAVALKDKYVGLPDMERNLPEEYRNWRALYDDVFQECVPLRARRILAVDIARCAMETEILRDYKEISQTTIREFRIYLKAADKSPRIRFRRLLNYIKKRDQSYLFKCFLEAYHRVEDALDDISSRSYENRKKSLEYSVSLLHAFERDASAIPVAKDTLSTSHNFERLVNDLVDRWKDYARCMLNETFDYSFRSTDLDQVDRLPEYQCVVYDCQPQTGLSPLSNVCDLQHPENYVASIIEWNNSEPFLLSEKPLRYLRQGDVYVRLLPVIPDLPRFFILSHGRNVIAEVLGAGFTGLLVRGSKYREFNLDVANRWPHMVVVVHWSSWSLFVGFVELKSGVEMAVAELGGEQIAFILRLPNGTYHLILAIGSNASLIFEEIRRLSSNVPVLELDGTAKRAFQTVFNNAGYLLGG